MRRETPTLAYGIMRASKNVDEMYAGMKQWVGETTVGKFVNNGLGIIKNTINRATNFVAGNGFNTDQEVKVNEIKKQVALTD